MQYLVEYEIMDRVYYEPIEIKAMIVCAPSKYDAHCKTELLTSKQETFGRVINITEVR